MGGARGEGGIKPCWLLVPTLGASLLKLFSGKDDSKQGRGVQGGGGGEVPSSTALAR